MNNEVKIVQISDDDEMLNYEGVSLTAGKFKVVGKDPDKKHYYMVLFDEDPSQTPISKDKYNIKNGRITYKVNNPLDFVGHRGESKVFGPFTVTGYLGKDGQHKYEVTFDNGGTGIATKANIQKGLVSCDGHKNVDPYEIVGCEYMSRCDGPIKVIEYIEGSKNPPLYKIQFLETGNFDTARKFNILSGYVKDHDKRMLVDYENVNGQGIHYKVLEYVGNKGRSKFFKVRFDTGYEYEYSYSSIVNNMIRDHSVPTLYGVGILDEPGLYAKYPKESRLWNSVLCRCYNENCDAFKDYGGCGEEVGIEGGVSVDPEWLHLRKFIDDLPSLPGYSQWKAGCKYDLDKDTLQPGVDNWDKVYSKDTCMFIPHEVNAYERHVREGHDINYIPERKVMCRIVDKKDKENN